MKMHVDAGDVSNALVRYLAERLPSFRVVSIQMVKERGTPGAYAIVELEENKETSA